MSRSRGWCVTRNNYDAEDIRMWQSDALKEKISYIVFEKEVGESGTPHLQGYAYFKNPISLKTASEWFPGSHLEVAKGSAQQNKKYCTKDNGDVVEWGVMPAQGGRSDIKQVKEIIAAGGNMRAVCEASTSYQAMRTGELLLKYKKAPVREPPRVLWFWGDTGTGKTRTAVEMGGDDYWISGRNLKWWDGYCGEKTVIIDDFRGDFCTLHELLRILDRYPYRVENKGGSTWLEATTIIITCPFEPQRAYNSTGEDMRQLLRRISEVRNFRTEVAEVIVDSATSKGKAVVEDE